MFSGRNQEPQTPAGSGQAYRVIAGFGIVSLLADFTYEGARSLVGPYLASLGAGAAAVATVAGAGEFAGQGLRFLFGRLADRTGAYWFLTIFGYSVNLLAVPLLALAGRWETAAALVILERLGKALRTPARDALLSRATAQVGHGKGFGIHEALDQIGAVTGPLFLSAVVAWRGDARLGFALLGLPAVLALGTLELLRRRHGSSRSTEQRNITPAAGPSARRLPPDFWWTAAGGACLAAGFADFALIAYHAQGHELLPLAWIPLFYAGLMAADGFAALLLGRWFDAHPRSALAATGLAAIAAPALLFSGGFWGLWFGGLAWALSLGGQESLFKARVATLVSPGQRATAFGIFQSLYGGAWFGGSILLGLLYAGHPVLFLAFATATSLGGTLLLLRSGTAGKPGASPS
ncbi:MAG: MFS transporter [Acidobacteriota bacterium]